MNVCSVPLFYTVGIVSVMLRIMEVYTNNEDRVSIAQPGYVYSKSLRSRIVTTVASVI